MTSRKYLLLTPSEFERVLKDLNFQPKRTTGDHSQWEGYIEGQRRIVTVQQIKGTFSVERMKTMIFNMGLTANEFYKVNPKISKRYFGR